MKKCNTQQNDLFKTRSKYSFYRVLKIIRGKQVVKPFLNYTRKMIFFFLNEKLSILGFLTRHLSHRSNVSFSFKISHIECFLWIGFPPCDSSTDLRKRLRFPAIIIFLSRKSSNLFHMSERVFRVLSLRFSFCVAQMN